jgi:uncharacterized protein
VTSRPLQVGVAELRRRLGTRRPIERQVALDGLGISTAAVPHDADVGVRLVVESISNGVVVEGEVTAPWVGECRRCLRAVEGAVQAEVREVFEESPIEGETYPLHDDTIDLEPLVRDAVLLALPLAPLCEQGCPGPAPETFPTGPDPSGPGPGGDEGPERDPRWAALDELRLERSDEGGGDENSAGG